MKERIKLPINERIKLPPQDWLGYDPERGDIHGYTFEQMREFAELIVRECMACSTWVGKVNKNAIEPVHTAHAINQRIKKHFGIEE